MSPVSTSITLLLFLTLLSLPFLSLSCHPDDKRALLQIKKSLNKAYDFPTWKPNTECCRQWDGVYCEKNANGRVTQFVTSHISPVPCQIPAAVGDLPYLEYLTMSRNPNLTGTIPPSIANLTRLVRLRLSENSLTGPVPTFLVKLHRLEFLDLSYNQLTGTIPPEFSHFKKMQVMRLQYNKLHGPIPISFRKVNLRVLALSDNLLTGDASHLFGPGNKNLRTVAISWNAFRFDLTKVVFPKSLVWLDLSHNGIYGSLPASLAGLQLQRLNVSYNQLCGEIPTGGVLQSFGQKTFFHNPCLCGAPLQAC